MGLINDIVEVRRWLNISSEETFGFRFFRQNELAIADLYRYVDEKCKSEADFGNRILALANLIDDIDVTVIVKRIGESKQTPGSINALEHLLRKEGKTVPSSAFEMLRVIRLLRSKRYPVHRDDKAFLEALEGLGFSGPPLDWDKLWVACLDGYLNSIRRIRGSLDEESGRLIEAVERVGVRDIAIIARMTGIPEASVEYALKNTFTKLGLRASIDVNYASLGLERLFGILNFSERAVQAGDRILGRLAQQAFLTHYSRQAIGTSYLVTLAVPPSLMDEFRNFLDNLVKRGVLNSYQTESLEWSKTFSISKHFDLKQGVWLIDWRSIAAEVKSGELETPRRDFGALQEPDRVDLLVVKELELDSWRSLPEISRKLGLDGRSVLSHYRRHVSLMTNSSYVQWLPSSPESFRKVMGLVFEFSGLSRTQLTDVRRVFQKIPFTLGEAGRKDGYYQSSMMVPPEHLAESLAFIKSELQGITDWKTHAIEISSIHDYTIPYDNFDERKGWCFDSRKAMAQVKLAMADSLPVTA